jgi:hypothetical protein
MPWNAWLQDANWLGALGTVIAVPISVIALVMSHRGQSAQQLREKREELRQILERLVSLRIENNELNKETDEWLKAAKSAFQNSARAMYLEAAEALAAQLPDVSAAEYYVLAVENQFDSDFEGSQKYFKLAAGSAKQSSPTKQCEILRNLAITYFDINPALRDIGLGREVYGRSLQVLDQKHDPYSCYCKVITLRCWAHSELSVPNLAEAERLLKQADIEWAKIPTNFGIQWTAELRNVVWGWNSLAIAYFSQATTEGDHIKHGRQAFTEALTLLDTLPNRYGALDDYTRDLQGVIWQSWGLQEHASGNRVEGDGLFAKAEDAFRSLADGFKPRTLRLAELSQARAQAGIGTVPSQLPLAPSPPDSTHHDPVRGRAGLGNPPPS